jgi:hypothetical protein
MEQTCKGRDNTQAFSRFCENLFRWAWSDPSGGVVSPVVDHNLRRLLLTADGSRKQLLARGESRQFLDAVHESLITLCGFKSVKD